MAGFLQKLLAQANPFDGGKTYSSLSREDEERKRREQQAAQARRRVSVSTAQPQQRISGVVNAPSQDRTVSVTTAPKRTLTLAGRNYQNSTRTEGSAPKQNFLEKNVIDRFSANTDLDKWKRDQQFQKSQDEYTKSFNDQVPKVYSGGLLNRALKNELEDRKGRFSQLSKAPQANWLRDRFDANTNQDRLSRFTSGAPEVHVNQNADGESRGTLGQITHPLAGSVMAARNKLDTGLLTILGQGIEQLPGTNNFLDKAGQAVQRHSDQKRQILDEMLDKSRFTTRARAGENSVLTNASSGVGSLGSALAITAATGNPWAAAGTFGVGAAGDQASQARAAGQDGWKSLAIGGTAGIVEAGLEKVGIDKIFKASGADKVFKRAAQGFISEALQEASQSLGQSVISDTYKDIDYTDAITQALVEGGYGGLLGAGGAVSIGAIDSAMKDPRVRQLANINIQEKLIKAAKDKSPDKVAHKGLSEADPEYRSMQIELEQATNEANMLNRAPIPNNAHLARVSRRIKSLQDAMANQRRTYSQGGFVGGGKATGFDTAKLAGRDFIGVDGKPRFEVDDSGATWKNFYDSVNRGEPQKLGDIFKHNKLFEQYPQLKDVTVKFDKSALSDGTKGQSGKGGIKLHTASFSGDGAMLAEDIKGTLLHEIQHQIQDVEGFAGGGAPVQADQAQINAIQQNLKENYAGLDRTADPDTRRKIISEIERLESQLDQVRSQPYKDYRNLAGEAEAGAVASRMNMTDGERYVDPEGTQYHGTNKDFAKPDPSKGSIGFLGRGFYLTPDKANAEYYAKKMVDEGKGGTAIVKKYAIDEKANLADMGRTDFDRVVDKFKKYGDKRYDKAVDFLKEQGYDGIDTGLDEVVIFNTNVLTDAKPQSTFYDSLDVPKQDLIVRDGSGKAMSVEPKAQQSKKYKTVHQGGKSIEVDGEPIDLVKGVETFVHQDENGNWAVSEASTGRDLTNGGYENKTFAIKAARDNINSVGEARFKQLISEAAPKAPVESKPTGIPAQSQLSPELQQAQPPLLQGRGSSGQQDLANGKVRTNPTPAEVSQSLPQQLPSQVESSSDNIIAQAVNLLPPPTPVAGLLKAGTQTLTPSQAKQRFKAMNKRGNDFEVSNQLPDGKQPLTVTPTGETRVGSNTIDIKQRDSNGKNINVKRNAPNLETINPSLLKDISGYGSRMKDIWRNTKKVFGNQYETVKQRVLDPLDAAKGRYVDFQEEYAQELKETVVDGLGIKKGSRDSELVQLYGEGKLTFEQVVERVGKTRAQKIAIADKFFRNKYDTLLDQINDSRMRTYNGNQEKLIPKRSDYYRHFQEMQQGIGGLLNIFENSAAITPELQGISQSTKPKSKWLSLAQRRKGDKTVYDAVGGYVNYLQASSYAINIDPEIARIRNFTNRLRDINSESKNPVDLENYLTFLDDYANDLSGKTNDIDRVVMKATGRKAFAVVDWVNKRAKANAILGNFASSVAQFYNMPVGLSDAGWTNAPAGFKGFVKSLTGGKTAANSSIFLKERFGDPLSQFDTKLMDKAQNGAAHLVQVGDEIGSRIIWHAQYAQAKGKGMSDVNAVKYADDRTRATVAGRGVGEVPIAQKAKAFQLIAPFQLEVANQWHVFGDWKGEGAGKMTKGLVGYSIAAALMNAAAEEIRGSGVIFDPIDALTEAWKELSEEDDPTTDDKDESKDNILTAGGRIVGEVAGNLPGGAYLAQAAISNPFTRKKYFGDEDPTRFGTSPLAITSTIGNALNIAQDPDNLYTYLKASTGLGTSFGGKQIERTIKAATDIIRGYATNRKGEPTYVAPDTKPGQAQALLFGTNSTNNAQDYYDNNRRALSGDKAEFIRDLPLGDRRDGIAKFRSIQDEQKAKKQAKVDRMKELGDSGVTASVQNTTQLKDRAKQLKDDASLFDKSLEDLRTENNLPEEVNNYEKLAAHLSGKYEDFVEAYDLKPKDAKKASGEFASLVEKDQGSEMISKAKKLYSDHPEVPDKIKKQFYKELGIEEKDIEYDIAAGFNSDDKASFLTKQLKDMDYDKRLNKLTEYRAKSLGGSYLANPKTLDLLVDAGLITKDDAKALKSINYDKASGKVSRKGTGGKGKKKKFVIPSGFTLLPGGSGGGKNSVRKLLADARVSLK